MKHPLLSILLAMTLATSPLFAGPSFRPFVETEQGTIGILSHNYQNGNSKGENPTFDFVTQGGQDTLSPFGRYSVGATIADVHRIWFTYQPLNLVTNVVFQSDVEIGPTKFLAGSPMELTYSFPFYRATYTYDLLSKYDNAYLGIGLAMQIRNVSIRFNKLDGTQLYVAQNVGLVPALALYSEYRFPFGLTFSADIAGSYANSSFFNGATYDFSGSILDASLSMAYDLPEGFALFGTLRYFGGTSDGKSGKPAKTWTESAERYSSNNIATFTASAGLSWTGM
ncbi:hypothetical protein [Sphaerochaeta sp. PS]|uniref:hypothetical protein n=1 Tax=Sphaerochaeta sp. PS TaxID=3076336 RepID=UPI0028A31199|nr:hypothetical protein [Sphaerochaeta sp. PS]MDT4761726.1 hypothetical protein [Sphaerochaeta sp. PS]